MRIVLALLLGLACATAAGAQTVEVKLDAETARAVLAAVQNPGLTHEQALAIAHMPGNEGLIRKQKSYGVAADEGQLTDALMAAAHHEATAAGDRYAFDKVRDNAPAISKALADLMDPDTHTLDQVKRRLALFTPPRVHGVVSGYLIAGGGSGGFAFGEPDFYLNMARFPSAPFARVILAHELYHAVRGLAAPHLVARDRHEQCVGRFTAGKDLNALFEDLADEGIASYVGDVLAAPPGDDAIAAEQYKHVSTNVRWVTRSSTLLELSVHALTTGSSLSYDDIYALGFYDDEILYALGYLMAKAIATERGPEAVADLIDRPGSAMVLAYAALKSYGAGKETPKLHSETIEWAKKLQACAGK